MKTFDWGDTWRIQNDPRPGDGEFGSTVAFERSASGELTVHVEFPDYSGFVVRTETVCHDLDPAMLAAVLRKLGWTVVEPVAKEQP